MDTLNFFLGENFNQKLLFFAILAAVSAIVGTWQTRPHATFCGANIYQKLAILASFRAASPHLQSQSGKISVRVQTWDSLLQAKFCRNCLRGVYPFLANLYEKLPILTI